MEAVYYMDRLCVCYYVMAVCYIGLDVNVIGRCMSYGMDVPYVVGLSML